MRVHRQGAGEARVTPADGDGRDWLRLTLDPQRLAVAGQLATAPRTAAEIVGATRLPERGVLEALGALVSADFEPGVTYPEATVDEILSRRHPDYASLRRYLVDEGLLERADGRYWRRGGRVDTFDGV